MDNNAEISSNLSNLENVQKIIKYNFKDLSLLQTALTHPSAVSGDITKLSYERLEFLGDSILGAIVASYIYKKYPNRDEGDLTKIKVALVSGYNLSKICVSLGIDKYIIFGKSVIHTGNRGHTSAEENVFEAIVGAIYLDGGIKSAYNFVEWTVLVYTDNYKDLTPQANAKSILQEKLQKQNICPSYSIISQSGPDHDKTFVACVCANNKQIGRGSGKTKKEAETNAAKEALLKI